MDDGVTSGSACADELSIEEVVALEQVEADPVDIGLREDVDHGLSDEPPVTGDEDLHEPWLSGGRAVLARHSRSRTAKRNSLPQAPLKKTFSMKCPSRRIPTPLEQRRRRGIPCVGDGDDAVQPERVERVSEERLQRLGGVALALMGRRERETHLGFTRLVGVDLQRKVPHECTARPLLECELEPLAGYAGRWHRPRTRRTPCRARA